MNFTVNAEPGSAINSVVPSSGISYFLFLRPDAYLRTGLDFSGMDYMYNENEKILPADFENREMYVFITTLDLYIGYRLVLSEWIELGIELGPSLVTRLPIALDENIDTGKGVEYFYGSLRFLYPGSSLYFKWNVTESLGLLFGARVLVPLFHYWDDEVLSLWNQMLISGRVGFCFSV